MSQQGDIFDALAKKHGAVQTAQQDVLDQVLGTLPKGSHRRGSERAYAYIHGSAIRSTEEELKRVGYMGLTGYHASSFKQKEEGLKQRRTK